VKHLFLLAGGTQRAAASLTSHEVDLAVLQLNTLSLISLTRSALPLLLATGRQPGAARVTAVSSAAGLLPSPGQASYCASKHALQGWFGTLRCELADTGVGVTLACPGPVATGGDGQPRLVFGSALAQKVSLEDGKRESSRMGPARCAELLVSAAGHGLDEAWVAKHPVLLLLWLSQFFPSLAGAVLEAVGPRRTRAATVGGDMYSVR